MAMFGHGAALMKSFRKKLIVLKNRMDKTDVAGMCSRTTWDGLNLNKELHGI